MIFSWLDLARTSRGGNEVQACTRWGRRVLVPEIMRNGDALIADVLDLACATWTISSGYRSPTVNAAVGGSLNSAHLVGLAADVEPPGPFAPDMILLARMGLPLDRVIYEVRGKSRWLHIQRMPLDAPPRPTMWILSPRSGVYAGMPLDQLAVLASHDDP